MKLGWKVVNTIQTAALVVGGPWILRYFPQWLLSLDQELIFAVIVLEIVAGSLYILLLIWLLETIFERLDK